MTALQKMYLETRGGGKMGHHATLRRMARETGIDEATIDRCLKRARRADAIDARRGPRQAQEAQERTRVRIRRGIVELDD